MQQEEILATGEKSSRALARVAMFDWDMEVINLAEDNQLEIYSQSRYSNGTADAGKALAPRLGGRREQ